MSNPPSQPRGLKAFAWFTAIATLGLIGLGGLVTSHGVGMAVPDWPTTFGYNMFLFPISQWVGGVFYEHTHRLYASVVGLLTVILAVWLQLRSGDRRVIRLGWLAVVLVVIQGVLGGLRVNLMKDQIGILHAMLAQAFLVLLVVIAIRISPHWHRWQREAPVVSRSLSAWVLLLTVFIFLQLILGASMRHQHAGLAVPDFPLAYGKVWPPTDEAFLHEVNARRLDTRDFHPITAAHVHLHMTHRWLGVVLAVAVLAVGYRLQRVFGRSTAAGRLGVTWMVLIGIQVALGAATVWSNKAADIATLHVVVGAGCLVVGAWSTLLVRTAVRRRGIEAGVIASGSGAGAGGSREAGSGRGEGARIGIPA